MKTQRDYWALMRCEHNKTTTQSNNLTIAKWIKETVEEYGYTVKLDLEKVC